MAEHTIETRILLRYDTYEHWSKSRLILKPGEAAIAVFDVSAVDNLSNTIPVNTPPAIGIKIGDGTHYFYELPWVQAVAADVYSWAKADTKPSYAANEISGLTSFIEQNFHISGDVTFAPRIYQIVQGTNENANKYYLRYKENNDSASWITDYNNPIDLSTYAAIATWIGNLVNQFPNIGTFTATQTRRLFEELSYTDTVQDNKFVTSVSENSGIISVQKAQPTFSNLSGRASVTQGGTGLTTLTENNVLVGDGTNNVKLIPIAESIASNNHLVPNYLIKNYVDNATAGLTGAMHFIGEATVVITNNSNVNPQIEGYNFSEVQPGDVILGPNKEEFVWANGYWRLLGDEGSYAVKGSITNVDIADNANIDESKINNLLADLSSKVDKIVGKSLSTNDFTNIYKEKLDNIEDNAQQNLIEHIYINDVEVLPTTLEDNTKKVISFRMSSLTEEEATQLRQTSEKVQLIENGAQVNKIESISIDGVKQTPDNEKNINLELNQYTNVIQSISLNNGLPLPIVNKNVNINLDESALAFEVITGAEVPSTDINERKVSVIDKKLQLARIAKTGSIYDINNTSISDYTDCLILRCGNASTLID